MALDSQTPRQPRLHGATQAGQAIVLVALLMVILLGILGLAIDGGGMFLLYRDAQNAADAASLTAAYARCTNVPDWQQRAYETLALNGFTEKTTDTAGNPLADDHPDYINLTVEPISGTNEILVKIEANKPSYFIQMLYNGPLGVDIEAVSICNPGGTGSASTGNDFAFRSLAGPGECTSSPAWEINGSQWVVEGDVWMPNIKGNVELVSPNAPDHSVANDSANILGNIFLGDAQTAPYNSDHSDATAASNALVEDVEGSSAITRVPDYQGHFGDGTIEYSVPEPGPLEHTMDYYRPLGSSYCTGNAYNHPTNPGECGGLQAAYPDDYHNLSDDNGFNWCEFGGQGITQQDYEQQSRSPGSNPFFQYWDRTVPPGTFKDGIYYAECDWAIQSPNISGNITIISEGKIDLSGGPYNITGYSGNPLIVSNYGPGTAGGNCNHNSYALQGNINEGSWLFHGHYKSMFHGDIILYNGTVFFQGNNFLLDSCISAIGFKQNGNRGSVYRCIGNGATVPTPSSINLER